MTATTELVPQPVTASEKSQKERPARTGATEVRTTPLRGAGIRITAAGAATPRLCTKLVTRREDLSVVRSPLQLSGGPYISVF